MVTIAMMKMSIIIIMTTANRNPLHASHHQGKSRSSPFLSTYFFWVFLLVQPILAKKVTTTGIPKLLMSIPPGLRLTMGLTLEST